MRKIYYVPGLINALLIPLLFWYYGNQGVHPQYMAIDLGLPVKVRPNRTFDNTFEPYRNWNYKNILSYLSILSFKERLKLSTST
ncbi:MULTISPECIES: hypothetical protein [Chryseobacterium]|uniref:hypothetical protein n=1 Tax=Chryseobacterium TaxID=59732 RepID=UPI001629CA80|nr:MULTISPECIES: hypothetical protein [Chryseobacterium]MDM1553203.1 hypothetical protein [Chryseobacterium indologenes]